MIIEFLNVVMIDKQPFAENVRLNIQPTTKQLRLKATYFDDKGGSIPIDIIGRWTIPKIEKLSLSMNISGIDMITNKDYLLKINFDIFKWQAKVVGKVSGKDIKIQASSIKDLLELPKYIKSLNII